LSLRSFLYRRWETFSYWGLVVGTLFFAASLTPSLLPRHFTVQGLLSGFALAAGYAVGVFFVWIWRYLELRPPSAKLQRVSKQVATVGVLIVAVGFLSRAATWQNSIRQLMRMDPVASAYPWRVALIAALTAIVLLAVARGLRWCWLLIHGYVHRVVPRRVSYVVSTILVVVLVLLLVNQVIARIALDIADGIYKQIDKVVDKDIAEPADSLASGSAESLIAWDSIGRRGKDFISDGPTEKQINQFWGKPAKRPLRVYVGLRSRDTTEERAKLALAELIRVGAFQRSVLIVATPTGTGWLDPGAVDTVEYLHRGDTAIVGVQYSYLPSWITILVDPQRSIDTARKLFDEVYG